jgi:GTPase SAR1 family protein
MTVDRLRRIRDDLLAQSFELVPRWLPNGTLAGDEWQVGSISGEAGASTKINLTTGVWCDFADRRQSGSDLISLYAAIRGLSYGDALQSLRKGDATTSVRELTAERLPTPRACWPVPADAPPPPLSAGQLRGLPKAGQLVAVWTYRNSSGLPIGYVLRFDVTDPEGGLKKHIRPLHYFDDGSGWLLKGHGQDNDPIYGLERLAAAPMQTVLLVEGEKTADAAAALFPDYVAISWMGGANRAGKVDWTPLNGRTVIYWPDADHAGEDSVDTVSEQLRSIDCASLAVVRPPFSLPRGWDLADEAPEGFDRLAALLNAEPVDLSTSQRLEALDFDGLATRLLFNSQTLQFFDPETGRRFDAPQLTSHFQPSQGKGLADRLKGDGRMLRGFGYGYRPGEHAAIFDDASGNSLINLWRGGGVEPTPGDAKIFTDHLRYLCSTEDEYEYLSNWLAFIAQKPGKKIMCALVLIGRQGTGKTAISQLLSKILGRRNVAVIATGEIRSDFNQWIEAKQLIFVEEAMTVGRLEVMNVLKPLITQEEININIKYQRPYSIENTANFIFFSNHHDALRLSEDDRRYFVVNSETPPKPPGYYKELFRWIQMNSGVAYHWLLERDLRAFDPNTRPPMTHGKSAMIAASTPPLEAIVTDLVEERVWPFEGDLIDSTEVLRLLKSDSGPAQGLTVNLHSLQEVLRRRGAIGFGQHKGRRGNRIIRVSLWAVRDVARYQAMSQSERLGAYVRDGEDRDARPF